MNPTCLLFLIFTIFELSYGDDYATQNEILERLLGDGSYDVNDHPLALINGTVPTKVDVQMYINSFGSLNAVDMEYSLDTFLRQMWVDPRLRFNDTKKTHLVIQDPDMRDRIWKPDTFFVNLKEGELHGITMPNVLFRVYQNGTVLYSIRLRMKLSCYMDFKSFPFDCQNCTAELSSYSRTVNAILYKWHRKNPIDIPNELEIAQFNFANIQTSSPVYVYATGNFSGLRVTFTLVRQNGYHLLNTYIPTIIIVSISWVSFWIDPNAVPGRVSLGVLTLLTLTTLGTGVRQQLPPVSYIKAIDVWVGVCMSMLFGGLLEFTLANYLANMKIPPGKTPVRIPSFLEFREPPHVPRQPTTYIRYALMVDRVSRVLFPVVFLLFNVFYWPHYITLQWLFFN